MPKQRQPLHSPLEIDTEALGDSVDVVEKGDDLGGVADGLIGQTQTAQASDVGLRDARRCARELDGMVAEGPVDVA